MSQTTKTRKKKAKTVQSLLKVAEEFLPNIHRLENSSRYFTRSHLIECARSADVWDYNRQVSDKVGSLPDLKFPVVMKLPHNHRHGFRCEPHMRCVVVLNEHGGCLVVDVPMRFYEGLPTAA